MVIIGDNGMALVEGSVDPVTLCTGYRASQLIMEPGDFEQLAELTRLDPQKAVAVLRQLDARMSRTRPTLADYNDVETMNPKEQE